MFGIIEGIETEAQFAMARRHGWQLAQGFLFGHALPPSEIALGLPEAPAPAIDIIESPTADEEAGFASEPWWAQPTASR